MQRTQLYLSEPEYEALRRKSFTEKKTMSAIVRELLRKEFKLEEKIKNKKKKDVNTLLNLAKKFSFDGPENLASSTDDVVYGKKK